MPIDQDRHALRRFDTLRPRAYDVSPDARSLLIISMVRPAFLGSLAAQTFARITR